MITRVGTIEIKIIEAVRISSISYAKSPLALLRIVTRTIPATKARLKNQRTFSNLVNTSFKAIPLSYSLFSFNKTISLTCSNIFKTYSNQSKQKPIVGTVVGLVKINNKEMP